MDSTTVTLLELQVPGISHSDSLEVQNAMSCGKLFPSVVDPKTRAALLKNILEVDCLIPSIRTFFQDTVHLEALCRAMRLLTGHLGKLTLRQTFFTSFRSPGHCQVEEYDGAFVSMDETSTQTQRHYAYVQVFLFAMRNLPDLTSGQYALPRKEKMSKKPEARKTSEALKVKFGRLAMNEATKLLDT